MKKGDRVKYRFEGSNNQILYTIVGTVEKVYKHSSGECRVKMKADKGQKIREVEAHISAFEPI